VTLARLAVALTLLAPATATAQRADDRVWLQAGAFFPRIDSDLRVDAGAVGVGTSVDLERVLGFKDRATVFAGTAGWRFARRWHVEGEYFALDRTSQAAIDRDIVVGDTTYPVGASVRGGLDSDVYRLSVGWSAIDRPRTRVNLALGLHMTDFRVRFEGNARVGPTLQTGVVERRELLAPLPTIGVYATHSLTERIALSARGDVFSLKVGDYDGTLWNVRAGADWRIAEHVGLGAGWRLVSYDAGVEGERLSGRIDYRFSGPYVGVTVGW
jgi:hypothetical protein